MLNKCKSFECPKRTETRTSSSLIKVSPSLVGSEVELTNVASKSCTTCRKRDDPLSCRVTEPSPLRLKCPVSFACFFVSSQGAAATISPIPVHSVAGVLIVSTCMGNCLSLVDSILHFPASSGGDRENSICSRNEVCGRDVVQVARPSRQARTAGFSTRTRSRSPCHGTRFSRNPMQALQPSTRR